MYLVGDCVGVGDGVGVGVGIDARGGVMPMDEF
jgi:hypothetical protein